MSAEPFAKLIKQNRALAERITNFGYNIVKANNEALCGQFFETYSQALMPVLTGTMDFKELAAVLQDADTIATAQKKSISDSIIFRFIKVKSNWENLLAEVTTASPELYKKLLGQRLFALRLLCLDETILAALASGASYITPMLRNNDDLKALHKLLLTLSQAQTDELSTLLPLAGKFWGEQIVPTGSELLLFLSACFEQGFRDQPSENWMTLLRESLPLLPIGCLNRKQWLVKLYEYSLLVHYVRPYLKDDIDARVIFDAFSRLTHFSSEAEIIKPLLPQVFKAGRHLFHDRLEFVTFCDGIKAYVLGAAKNGVADDLYEAIKNTEDLSIFSNKEPSNMDEKLPASDNIETLSAICNPTQLTVMSNPSAEFLRYRESFFGDPYMAWHDGRDINSLQTLTGLEREVAEKELLAELEKSRDPRIAEGLGALQSRDAVIPLRKRLEISTGSERVAVAAALWQIEHSRLALAHLTAIVSGEGYSYDRMDAVIFLRHAHTEIARTALWVALDDVDNLVRCHATVSLLILHGMDRYEAESNNLSIAMMRDSKEEREQTKKELAALIGIPLPDPAMLKSLIEKELQWMRSDSEQNQGEKDNSILTNLNVSLQLSLQEPKKLTSEQSWRWADLIKIVKGDALYLIFWAELLAILDQNSTPWFNIINYSDGGIFSRDEHWQVGTQNISIERCISTEINDSWQHMDVNADWVRVNGLPNDSFIDWDGQWGIEMEFTIGNISSSLEKPVLELAHSLFAKVNCRYQPSSTQGKVRAMLKREWRSENAPEPAEDNAVEILPLLAALSDEDSDVGLAALARLKTHIDQGNQFALDSLISVLMSSNEITGVAIAQYLGLKREKKAVSVLKQTLKKDDSSLRENAAAALGKIGDRSAMPGLLVCLNDEDAKVRKAAVIAIGELLESANESNILKQLASMLKDEDQYVRDVTAWTLADHPHSSMLNPLMRALNDSYFAVRDGAALALGKIGDKRAIKAILPLLSDQEKSVCLTAIDALVAIGDIQATPALNELVNDKYADRQVKEAAAEAIKKLSVNKNR